MSNFHVHSDYSTRDGIQSVSKIIDFQLSIGKKFFAITDHGICSSFTEAEELVKKYAKNGKEIKFMPGCEFYLKPDDCQDNLTNIIKITALNKILMRKTEDIKGQKDQAKIELDKIKSDPLFNTKYFHITILAFNQKGLENLYLINNNGDFHHKHRIKMEDLIKWNEGLIVLTGCPAGVIFKNIENNREDIAELWLRNLKETFNDRVYFELMFHDGICEIEKLPEENDYDYKHRKITEEKRIYEICIKIARKVGVKIVATNDSHYTTPEDRRYWKLTRLAMIGDKYDLDIGDYSMTKDNKFISDEYDTVTEEELDESENEIVSRLEDISLPRSKYESTAQNRADFERIVWTGFKNKRLGTKEENESLLKIPYELSVIQTKGFDKYFLVCRNVVSAAFERGVLMGPARGSSAGSEISNLVDINKCDPIKYGLMFERFLNEGRDNLPDIDIDFQSIACSNFDPTEDFYKEIDLMFAKEVATDDEIASYWVKWKNLVEKEPINLRKEVYDKNNNWEYFEGPIWEHENLYYKKN